MARGAPEAAITYLQRALTECPRGVERVEILLELGTAGLHASHPDATRWLEIAAQTATEPMQRAQAVFALIDAVAYRNEHLPDGVWEVVPNLDGEQRLALDAVRIIAEYGFWGTLPVPPAKRRRIRIPEGKTWPECTWLAAAAFRALMEGAPAEQVIDLAEKALSNGVLLVENPDAWAHGFAGLCLHGAGRLTSAFGVYDDAYRLAVRTGSLIPFEWSLLGRARIHLQLGRLSEAEADIQTSLNADHEHGWVLGRPAKTTVVITALAGRYGPRRAAQALAKRGPGPAAPGSNFFDLWEVEGRGWLNMALGCPEPALGELLACGRRLEELHSRSSAWFG